MGRRLDQVQGHQLVKEQVLALSQKKSFFSGSLFVGPQGIGKRLIALATVQELNCKVSQPACGQCATCLRLEKEEAPEFVFNILPVNGVIKVDAVREAQKFLSLQSWVSHRFVVVDDAEAMNPQAANSLLKSLEEPPEGSHFIFVTSNVSSVMPTIRSRCQIFSFPALSEAELMALYPELENWQARWCMGRPELAQKILSEEWSHLRKVAINALYGGEAAGLTEQLVKAFSDKEKLDFVVHCWKSFLRDAILLAESTEPELYNEDVSQFTQKWAHQYPAEELAEPVEQLYSDITRRVDRGLVLDQWNYQLSKMKQEYS